MKDQFDVFGGVTAVKRAPSEEQTKKTEPKETSFDTDGFFEVSLKRSYANEAARTDTSDAALLSALKASVGVTA